MISLGSTVMSHLHWNLKSRGKVMLKEGLWARSRSIRKRKVRRARRVAGREAKVKIKTLVMTSLLYPPPWTNQTLNTTNQTLEATTPTTIQTSPRIHSIQNLPSTPDQGQGINQLAVVAHGIKIRSTWSWLRSRMRLRTRSRYLISSVMLVSPKLTKKPKIRYSSTLPLVAP